MTLGFPDRYCCHTLQKTAGARIPRAGHDVLNSRGLLTKSRLKGEKGGGVMILAGSRWPLKCLPALKDSWIEYDKSDG